jgi:hypothetical protein
MMLARRIPGFLLVGAGLALTIAVYRLWTLLLTNLYVPGSLAWTHPLVLPLALLLSSITVLPYTIVAYRLRLMPGMLRLLLAALIAVGAWIVYPVVCDTHESFVDRPNARCACAGLTVHWYPRGVFDYSEVVYCIGVETPVR